MPRLAAAWCVELKRCILLVRGRIPFVTEVEHCCILRSRNRSRSFSETANTSRDKRNEPNPSFKVGHKIDKVATCNTRTSHQRLPACLKKHAHIHKSMDQSPPRESNSSLAIQQKLKALNKAKAEILAKIQGDSVARGPKLLSIKIMLSR